MAVSSIEALLNLDSKTCQNIPRVKVSVFAICSRLSNLVLCFCRRTSFVFEELVDH